ncbi:MAG: M14 family zinc carboxypeptidase [Planctomycetota bacterium]
MSGRGWATFVVVVAAGLGALGCTTPPSDDALAGGAGQDRLADVEPDAAETAAIREHTSDPSYLTPLVDRLPDHPTVPSPRDYFGYTVGTPQQLSHAAKIHAYYRELAAKSDRVAVFESGTSREGRDTVTIAVAEPALLAGLVDNIERLKRLGDGRESLGPDELQALIADTTPVYWITAGLHSTELGPPEVCIEMAYRLAVSESDHARTIRQGVITLITPVLDADGRERQVDWYHRHVKGHPVREDMPPRSPPFWGHYTYHDNNRDAIMLSQPTTQNYLRTYLKFRPTVSLDMHESVPLLYVSMGTGPYNPVIDPITQAEWQWMSAHEVSVLSGMGLKGVWTWGFYTGWAPSYLLWVTNLRNSCGRFYETFGNGTADTQERRLTEASYAGEKVVKRTWHRGDPPPKTLTWSMRDNVNYMQSGALTSLHFVATHGKEFLRNHRRKAEKAIALGKSEKPYAYAIPAEQRDPAATRDLIDVLLRHGLEVHRLNGDWQPESGDGNEAGGVKKDGNPGDREGKTPQGLRGGDYIVRCDQPWRPLVNVLLGKQEFPKDAQHAPYDDVGWTMGLMMGVEVKPLKDASILEAPMAPTLEPPVLPRGKDVPAPGEDGWIVPADGRRDLGPFRFALGDLVVMALDEASSDGETTYPAGSLVIPAGGDARTRLAAAADRTGILPLPLSLKPAANAPAEMTGHEVDLPRVAVLMTWTRTQDTGWLRYALDHFGIPYTLITKERVHAGDLKKEFDVILFANNGGFNGIVHGIDTKWGPMPYTTTEQFPSHGTIIESPDITGGIEFAGLAELQQFVRAGGNLVTLGAGAAIATDSGMARGVASARGGGPLPGSVLTAKVRRRDHPLTYGYDDVTHLFRANVPGFSVRRFDERYVVFQWGTKPPYPPDDPDTEKDPGTGTGTQAKRPLVLSGGYKGFERIDGKPAVVDVPVGKGHIVLIGPAVTRRFQDHQDFPLLWNALLHWNDFPAPDPADQPGRRK